MAKKNFVGPKGARLLRKVAKHILAEPRRYNQNEVCSIVPKGVKTIYGHPVPPCRTIACIGGWLQVLTTRRRRSLDGLPFAKLRTMLGVNNDALSRLTAYTHNVGSSGWPSRFRKAYIRSTRHATRAKIAAARIEWFIKTGQ